MLAEVLLAAGAALLLRHLCWVCRAMWLTRNMPGPRGYPVIGNYLDMAGPQEEFYSRINGVVTRYKCTLKAWQGPVLVILLVPSEDVQAALSSPYLDAKTRILYSVLDPILGRGLVSLWGGETYKLHRRTITPSFHADKLKGFMGSFNRNARLMAVELGAFPADTVVDMTVLSGRCANRSACENLLVMDASLLDKERDGYVKMTHLGAEAGMYRLARPWNHIPGVFFTFSPDMHAQFYKSAAFIEDFVAKILRIKEAQLEAMTNGEQPQKGDWLLEHLMGGGLGLSRKELKDEIRTVLFTSTMTSTDFLSFFFMTMSVLPDVQRKVQEEVATVIGDDLERDVEAADLPRLQYTECVMKEVLRFFPVVPIFGREALRDIPLPSGATIPRGAIAGFLPVHTHEDERWFPQPSEFRPERFLPENSQGRPHHAYIPFSAGQRACLGQRYAMMFGKTLIATVLREYDILPVPGGPTTVQDIPITGSISLSVHGNARVLVRRRSTLKGQSNFQ